MPEANLKSLFGLAAFCAVGSTVGWVCYVVGSAGLPELPPVTQPVERLAIWRGSLGLHLLYGWGGVFGALLSIPYLFAFVSAMASRRRQLWIAFISGFAGAFMAALSFMTASLAPVYFVLPQLADRPDLAEDYLLAMQVANSAFEPIWFIGSFLAYGLAPVWIAGVALRFGVAPRWLNWAGIAGGTAGIIWLRPFLVFLMPAAVPGSAANILLLSVWAVGMSWWLFRQAA